MLEEAGSKLGSIPFRGCATSFVERITRWWRAKPIATAEPAAPPAPGRRRGVVDHVIILDGTLSLLEPGYETNAGLLLKLLLEDQQGVHRRVYYEEGLQWEGIRHAWGFLQGRGINRQIARAYGWLASQYRPGDRIFLFGYSRGAYAVRSLAGVIDRVGLVRREKAVERVIRLAYRHYRLGPDRPAARAFARTYCHAEAPIEMVGVWDTVKALGLRLPLLWMLTDKQHQFHNHHLGSSIRHGFQALALHETRAVFDPVMWDCPPGWEGNIQQVWFRGGHSDVGGQVGTYPAARPLANIPLVWMLEKAEALGLALPPGWRGRYPCDPKAPMYGTTRGWAKLFLLRRPRVVGRDPSEAIHPSAEGERAWSWMPWPLTRLF
ncbi:MAG: DUF2235 domain-containing protein [Pseudorhodobacter sp.]|nr:MAG: DUF2235 domain-containing protein [Pseudorhodobacter sp.]